MKKIIYPGFAVGAALLVISLLLGRLWEFVLPGLTLEYQKPGLFRPWSDPLMLLYFVHPFVLGAVLAWAWERTGTVFKQRKGRPAFLDFALFYWLVAALPGMWISYSSFPLSVGMIISWSVNGFIQAVIAGWILARLNR